jgi:hypothetical protein
MDMMEKSAIQNAFNNESQSSFESDLSNLEEEMATQMVGSEAIEDIFLEFKQAKVKSSKRDRNNPPKLIDLTPYAAKSNQVSEYDLRKTELNLMRDRRQAKRLEFAQLLVENLTRCALLAGSTDNITVNCVLLNDSIF